MYQGQGIRKIMNQEVKRKDKWVNRIRTKNEGKNKDASKNNSFVTIDCDSEHEPM